MFSSLTSFLPPALHLNNNSNANAPPVVDDDDDDDEVEEVKPEEGEASTEKKKTKKAKGANETFIFVRPPPAKSNHPLNLQVQLVPPNARAPGVTATPRQSLDGEPPASPSSSAGGDSETGGAALARTVSAQSSRSEISAYSSSGYASTSSFSSVASTSSGRRMIIPLYNLQAHNVMTNTIVDAGTDAKIAKFTKRGLEMIDLAVLEVVEVWVPPAGANSQTNGNGTKSTRGSVDESSQVRRKGSFLQPQQASSRPVTPDPEHLTPGSSAVSVSSAGLSAADIQHHQTPIALPISSGAPPQKKNIFGKFFNKKKDPNATPTLPSSPSFASSPTPTKTPTQMPTVVPPSPTSPSRHTRNLSASLAGFRRSPSASPSRPMSPGHPESSGLGIRGLMKSARPNSFLETGDITSHDYAFDGKNEFGLNTGSNAGTTSSRLSSSSKMSGNLEAPSMSSTGANGSSATGGASAPAQGQLLPATLGIQPTLSSPGGPAALQAFANFTSSGYPPPKNLGYGKGPAMYVWVVRKWIKTPEGTGGTGLFGLASGMRDVLGGMGAAGGGLGSNAASAGGLAQVEVRMEWKRGKKPKSKKKGNKEKEKENVGGAENGFSRAASRSASQIRPPPHGVVGPSDSNSSLPSAGTNEEGGGGIAERKKKNRLSTLSAVSTSISEDIHDAGSSTGGQGSKFSKRGRSKRKNAANATDDDGDESDPEDSETPWTCMVKVRRLGSSSSSRGGSNPLKVKVGTLSPTPHHPKVVAMLKVPFPLPDLEVQNMVARKRVGPGGGGGGGPSAGGPAPGAAPGLSPSVASGKVQSVSGLPVSLSSGSETGQFGPGLVLTAEEIKDVVCCTGMWVVVREGFGGVGKVSRKGDGWRIRA